MNQETNKSVYVITVLDCTERPLRSLYVVNLLLTDKRYNAWLHKFSASDNKLQRFQLLSVLATNYVFFVTDADLQIVMLIIILGVIINCFYGVNCFTL